MKSKRGAGEASGGAWSGSKRSAWDDACSGSKWSSLGVAWNGPKRASEPWRALDNARSESETTLLSVTSMDLSILDCPICKESLVSPVYQCENGHIACASCCTKTEHKCPYCRLPIGAIRCRVLEKVLESVTVNCRNAFQGCTDTFKLNKKLDKLNHEKICRHMQCTCPDYNCSYIGISESLYKHFSEAHSPSTFSFNTMKSISLVSGQTKVFLQDSSRSTLFILNRTIATGGSSMSVISVGPDLLQEGFSFVLKAVIDRDTYVKIKAGVVCVPKWTDDVLGKCLILPRDLLSDWGILELELIIRRSTQSLCSSDYDSE